MTDKQKIDKLRACFEDTISWAIRYAHGRHTYAPSSVRRAVKEFQSIYPDWKPQDDKTIKPPEKMNRWALRDDYLDDLFV